MRWDGVRHDVYVRLMHELEQPGLVVLVGTRGSGSTAVLGGLSATLRRSGTAVCSLSMRDADAADRLASAPLDAVHVLDDLEYVSPEALTVLRDRVRSGARGVCAYAEDHPARPHLADDEWNALVAPRSDTSMTRYVRLEPLTYADSLRIIAETRSEYLDACTSGSLHEMSWGRPAWLLELLQLAALGAVRSAPWPAVSPAPLRDLNLETFRYADSLAIAELSDGDIATAVVLSELDPRTHAGQNALVGAPAVAALTAHGLLVQVPHDETLWGVPQLYASALRLRADPAQLAELERQVANRLQAQESLGVSLTDREAYFCASRSSGAIHPEAAEQARGDAVRGELVRRVAIDFLAFGATGEVRDLLLRGAEIGVSLAPLDRARVAMVLHGPLAGMRALSAAGNADEGSLASRLARQALTAQFLVESSLPQPDAPPETGSLLDSDRDELDGKLVIARWNDHASIDPDALAEIAARHPIREISLLAEQLVDLENVRRGMQPERTATPVERIARATGIAMNTSEELRDLAQTAVVTEALLAFYMGDTSGSDAALDALAEALPGTPLHRIWLTHLGAAGKALLAGDLRRAHTEWELMEGRLPKFIPARLRAFISHTGHEITRAVDGYANTHVIPDAEDLTAQFLAYVGGRLDRIGIRPQRYGRLHSQPEKDPRELPIAKLARLHVQAVGSRNPTALLAAAEQLAQQHFWGPAAFAIQEARSIYVRRRATGSVNRCTSLLQQLEQSARQSDPWFTFHELPSGTHLTPRELATARLAVDGLTNKEMAEKMRCSVRTVESHLAQARAKLGAANRAELASIMREFAGPESKPKQPREESRPDSRAASRMR